MTIGTISTCDLPEPTRSELLAALAALAQTSREEIQHKDAELARAQTALRQIIEISGGPIRRIAQGGLGE